MPCNSLRVFRAQLTINNAAEIVQDAQAVTALVKLIESKTTHRPITAQPGYNGSVVIRVGQYISLTLTKQGGIEVTTAYERSAAQQLLSDIESGMQEIAGLALRTRLTKRLQQTVKGKVVTPFKQGLTTIAATVRV